MIVETFILLKIRKRNLCSIKSKAWFCDNTSAAGEFFPFIRLTGRNKTVYIGQVGGDIYDIHISAVAAPHMI